MTSKVSLSTRNITSWVFPRCFPFGGDPPHRARWAGNPPSCECNDWRTRRPGDFEIDTTGGSTKALDEFESQLPQPQGKGQRSSFLKIW